MLLVLKGTRFMQEPVAATSVEIYDLNYELSAAGLYELALILVTLTYFLLLEGRKQARSCSDLLAKLKATHCTCW